MAQRPWEDWVLPALWGAMLVLCGFGLVLLMRHVNEPDRQMPPGIVVLNRWTTAKGQMDPGVTVTRVLIIPLRQCYLVFDTPRSVVGAVEPVACTAAEVSTEVERK